MRTDPDYDRYRELVQRADLGVNLWQSLLLAAERGDDAAILYHCKQIRILTRTAFALVKTLQGDEEREHG